MAKVLKSIFSATLVLILAFSSLSFGNTSTVNASLHEQRLLVVFQSENLPSNVNTLVSKAGGQITYEVPQIGVIEVATNNPGTFLKEMLKNKQVLSIGPSVEVNLELPEFETDGNEVETNTNIIENIWESGYQWDIEQVTNNGASHSINKEGRSEVVVAVIDTGFDFNHPDLVANVDLEGSKTFVPGTTDSWDWNSHGTHVAGTIGADGRMKGVAPGVTLRSYRVFGATGGAQQIWITDAIIAAANDGVDVINMSLGGTRLLGQWFYTNPNTGEKIRGGNSAADYTAYTRAVRYAVKKGATVVASAGNSSYDLSNPSKVAEKINEGRTDGWEAKGAVFYVPAQIPGVVTVSSIGAGFGTENRLAYYSNYGNGAIDLGAPGGDLGPNNQGGSKHLVLSAVPTYMTFNTARGLEAKALFGEGYGWKGGTSMAAPQVSGAAAAYIASVLADTGKKPSPMQVQTRLQQTAVDAGKNGYDEIYGHGIVNAHQALLRNKK
ncbi:S8 family serine peptidase [Sutcliffiella sp. NC1]|uniref:S8 family serine peptidase n=1 Tax=Sutcliffiella sp. NC1 TaxID=3004096 RepID=UPI0022DDABD4|nr:S8 family serine peptidase [Sutcliffiella sp. NC1]WBL14227.1 S8 family serine peptidase [Sutcliffiella sp. NC1]